MKRILIVAPEVGLDVVSDILSAVEGNQPTVLGGTVTTREVLNRIATGGYEVIHFATHGGGHVLQMSDGLLGEDLLEQALRASGGIELVVLNACMSIHTGAQIYRAGVPRVISWRDAVDDAVAAWWASAFYRHLTLAGDAWEAYRAAVEGLQKQWPAAEMPIWLDGRLATLELEVAQMWERLERQGGRLWLPAWALAAQVALMVVLVGAVLVGARGAGL